MHNYREDRVRLFSAQEVMGRSCSKRSLDWMQEKHFLLRGWPRLEPWNQRDIGICILGDTQNSPTQSHEPDLEWQDTSQGPCHQNNSLTLHSGFADRKARHEGGEITQPQACRGPASEATYPESNLKSSPHCFWVNQTHRHSCLCVLGFMESSALFASQVEGSTSLA